MSQKWPEMVVEPDMCSHFYIESVYNLYGIKELVISKKFLKVNLFLNQQFLKVKFDCTIYHTRGPNRVAKIDQKISHLGNIDLERHTACCSEKYILALCSEEHKCMDFEISS